ncbi:MAG: preprotein translocase subunit SecA [Parcubacteria group bacterium]
MSFFSKLFGNNDEGKIKEYEKIVATINELEQTFESFSLDQLKDKTKEFRKRLEGKKTLDDILPEAFAAVREAAKRTLGQRHYDVQLIGGMALHTGSIAQMRTGEGKTLAATAAVYLNALEGKGVHVVTVNDYLSQRDAAWMGQIYDALGLTTACVNHNASFIYDPDQKAELDKERDTSGAFKVVHEFLRPLNSRREAYEADITYGTNNEFGFDYLRDNMVHDVSQIAQAKGHNFAIVDEVDSILIDESRTPLIISAPDTESTNLYETFSRVVPKLQENVDYNIDEKLRAVSITEEGINKVEGILKLKNIYEEGGTRYVHHLEQALKAQILFHKDKEYVIKDGQVIIVDEFTGRLMPGRRWSGGLHQAVEAKEGVYVQKESRTFATITFQNYFRLYGKLSGMTGTAKTSQEEFHEVYNLDVVVIPTNKPMIREDMPDSIYKTEDGKMRALAREVKERSEKGQPVLIGTVSIAKNELVSSYLKREGASHEVLNAKKHEQEGSIIAQAGRLGAVTVATNMAGRGVDVILGGNPPNKEDADKVRELGGLHVIGTERHEARRIDDQLRGRAGRQGDPGSSQFFISTEDDVARIFGGDRLKSLMNTLGVKDDDAIENKMISRQIEKAQEKIEGHHFDARKHVLEYDDVMSRHRKAIYKLRREIVESENNKDRVIEYIKEQIDRLVAMHGHTEHEDMNTEEITEGIKAMIPLNPKDAGTLHAKINEAEAGEEAVLIKLLYGIADTAYVQKESQQGPEAMRKLEKAVLLRVIDELWIDHLETMENLRDSVRLRAYGQRDPLVEYKVEGQRLFNELQGVIGTQVANMVYKVGFIKKPENRRDLQEKHEDASRGADQVKSGSGVSSETNRQAERKQDQQIKSDKVGRNDPCPCGSGKKYKRCHLNSS